MPHILSGARAIGGSVISEEGVAGIGVHLILVSLVVLVQFLPQPGRVGAGDGLASSSPKRASNGHDRLATMSIAATGRAAVGPSSGMMCPPAESTAAFTLLLVQANMSVYRPPEQKPMIPTLPLACGLLFRKRAAPSRSPMVWESGTEKRVSRTLSGAGRPSRVYRSGAALLREPSAQVFHVVLKPHALHGDDHARIIPRDRRLAQVGIDLGAIRPGILRHVRFQVREGCNHFSPSTAGKFSPPGYETHAWTPLWVTQPVRRPFPNHDSRGVGVGPDHVRHNGSVGYFDVFQTVDV